MLLCDAASPPAYACSIFLLHVGAELLRLVPPHMEPGQSLHPISPGRARHGVGEQPVALGRLGLCPWNLDCGVLPGHPPSLEPGLRSPAGRAEARMR